MQQPVKVGRAAELYFHAKCLLQDLECYAPSTEDGRVDLLVGAYHHRCQVKLLRVGGYDGMRYLDLEKRKGPAGSGIRFRYGPDDVDFMVGVNPKSFAVYIVPIASTALWGTRMSEQALARMGTREAFHFLRARPGEAVLPVTPRLIVGHRPVECSVFTRPHEDQLLLLGSDFV